MTGDLNIVILAAGLGTRMVSRKAKVLHEAGGLTLIEHVVNAATALTTPDRVAVVVGHQADRVEKTLANRGVRFAIQKEQKGTGHALAQCAPLVQGDGGRLLVVYGDCPLLQPDTLRSLVERHAASGVAGTLIVTELADPTGYGRVLLDSEGYVQAIVEQKVATAGQKAVRVINSGIYCFEGDLLWKYLPHIEPNPVSNEYYLTDIVEILNRGGRRMGSLHHANADELLGINTRAELAAVDNLLRERKVNNLQSSGVTVLKPGTVTVDASVQIGMDSIVEPFAQILGNTAIGEECRIGTGAILRDCRLANHVEIAPYTIMNGATVEANASIGPFARLRGGDIVEAGAHIGNFVELKQTRLGAGAKAGHFAYLGDATIGAGSNIGAGTIVCNYDGVQKHKSSIGEGAFIGSNSTLVAPAEIGGGSYVAAGSVITEPVPEDALAVGRGRQSNKEGWAKRRRESQAAKPTAS